jgi:hypothetical protein
MWVRFEFPGFKAAILLLNIIDLLQVPGAPEAGINPRSFVSEILSPQGFAGRL